MVEGPSLPNLHALGLLDNKGSSSSTDELANEDIGKLLEKAPNKLPGTIAKLSEAIPFIGKLLAAIIPTNAGEVGIFASLNRDSFIDKQVNQSKGGTTGGVLWNIVASVFKRSDVTDQTGGTGGGGGGDFASGGGSGWSDTGGGFDSHHAHVDFGRFTSSEGMFDWTPMSYASLGGLSAPPLPAGMAAGIGAGMEIG